MNEAPEYSRFYLAYGMNTNSRQMAMRCPDAICIGKCVLPGFRLVFRGFADIEQSPNDTLECVLWDITPKCEDRLDVLEGYPHYYDKGILKVSRSGRLVDAMIYYMTHEDPYHAPSLDYQYMLEDGYTEHGLNVDQIYNAPGFNTVAKNNWEHHKSKVGKYPDDEDDAWAPREREEDYDNDDDSQDYNGRY